MTSQVFCRFRKPERPNYNGRGQQQLRNHMFFFFFLSEFLLFEFVLRGESREARLPGTMGRYGKPAFCQYHLLEI
ncbi:unnamed protein product [Ixodes persulcatus]